MSLFKNKYRIESFRLPFYDYSVPGYYFITICTKSRVFYFGNIMDGKLILSREGLIVKRNLQIFKKNFSNIDLDAFIVMPNHVHMILIIEKQISCGALINQGSTQRKAYKLRIINNPMLLPVISLGYIMRLFKAKSSFLIRKKNKNFCWQTLYHEHIVRNESELNRIREYIQNNPKN